MVCFEQGLTYMFQQTDDKEGEEVKGGGEGKLGGLQRGGKVTTIHPGTVNHHIHKGLGGKHSITYTRVITIYMYMYMWYVL